MFLVSLEGCSCFPPLISDLHLQAREIMDTGTVGIITAPGGEEERKEVSGNGSCVVEILLSTSLF